MFSLPVLPHPLLVLLLLLAQSTSIPGATALILAITSDSLQRGYSTTAVALYITSLSAAGSAGAFALANVARAHGYLSTRRIEEWAPGRLDQLRRRLAVASSSANTTHRPGSWRRAASRFIRHLSAVVGLRCSPVPNWMVNLGSPIVGIDFFPFTVGSFVGLLLPSALLTQAGEAIIRGEHPSAVLDPRQSAALWLVGGLVLLRSMYGADDVEEVATSTPVYETRKDR